MAEVVVAIPPGITGLHIRRAAVEIERNGVPATRRSAKYDVLVAGAYLPPKYVVSIACRLATGQALDPGTFSGGAEANGFLRDRGFVIADKRGHIVSRP